MTKPNPFCCESLTRSVDEESIIYVPKFREWGIPILDGGSSFVEICYCPWCGRKLPDSLRDKWFDEAERLKIKPPFAEMPMAYQSEEWWQAANAPDS